MKTVLGLSLVMAAALALGGCSKDHGDVMDDMASEMNSLADVLSKVKDEASAKAARSDVESIAENMKDLRKTAEGMKEPTEAEAKKLIEKMGETMKATQKMMGEIVRIQSIPAAWAVLKDALNNVDK